MARCTYQLASVVLELATRAGLDPTTVDTNRLEGEVRGFAVTNAYPAFASIRSLSEIFMFDPANFDGRVRFIHRGENAVAVITEDDMTDDEDDIEQSRRGDSMMVPRVLNLNYHDIDGGLATDKQTSERAGDRRHVGEAQLQTAVVLNADEAARVIAISHKVVIEDQKGELKFCLSDRFIRLTETDIIIVQWQGRSERCRITQVDTHDGYQEYRMVRDRQSAYTSNVEGIPPAPQTPPPGSIVGPTIIAPLDIAILRDADDSLGYYMALSGIFPAWQGALVELSRDGGANYVDSDESTLEATMGETITPLAPHPQAYPDVTNSVTVRIDTPFAELDETDLEGMMNRNNLAMIGDELLQFGSADETSPGEWVLSNLIRGRRGTLPASHAPGSRFVLLDRNTLPYIPANLSDLGKTLTFRATSFGSTDSQTANMSYTGRAQRERAPAYVKARFVGSALLINWQGVGRLGSGVSAAHGTNFAGYRVVIFDGVISQAIDTTAQQLMHDASAFTLPLTITVYQRNAITGLGPGTSISIGGAGAESVVNITVGGVYNVNDTLYFTIVLNVFAGSQIVREYEIEGAGKSDVVDYLTALKAEIDGETAFADVDTEIEGSTLKLSTLAGILSASYVNNTAVTVVSLAQAPAPSSSGTMHFTGVDLYHMVSNPSPPPSTIEALSPTTSTQFAVGSFTFRFTVSGLSYDARKALGPGGSKEFLVPASFTLGEGYPAQYTWSLGQLATAIAANSDLSSIVALASVGLSSPLPNPMIRAACRINLEPNFTIASMSYETTPSNVSSGVAPYKLLAKTHRQGTPDFPSGAEQIVTVRFFTPGGIDPPRQSVVAGQVYKIVLDDVEFSHTVDSSDETDQLRRSIFEALGGDIDADAKFDVDYTYFDRLPSDPMAPGQFITEMEIRRSITNTPFTFSVNASFGIEVTIT